jgi:ribosome maturation factor RimP
MSVQEDVASAIRPIIEAAGNYLEEVKIIAAGKRKLITVIVDSDSYLNLDQVTSVTRSISDVIEGVNSLGDTPFTLEVTSPGTDRPLTLPRHWKKNHGKLVKISLIDGAEVEGRIANSSEIAVELDTATVNFSDIKKALLQIERRCRFTHCSSG